MRSGVPIHSPHSFFSYPDLWHVHACFTAHCVSLMDTRGCFWKPFPVSALNDVSWDRGHLLKHPIGEYAFSRTIKCMLFHLTERMWNAMLSMKKTATAGKIQTGDHVDHFRSVDAYFLQCADALETVNDRTEGFRQSPTIFSMPT